MDSITTASAYDDTRLMLVANGYYPLPIGPGTKKPMVIVDGEYREMVQWQSPDRSMAPSPQPGAGVGMRLGLQREGAYLVALDWDNDDLAIAAMYLFPSAVHKEGVRGFTSFFVAHREIPSKDFRVNNKCVVQVLSTGRQTVLPPTIHPDTGKPYIWTTDRTLLNTSIDSLPELPPDYIDRIKSIIADAKTVLDVEEEPRQAPPEGYDEDGPFAVLNQAAMKDLAAWVPDLNLYKCRRKVGRCASYEAVATWRESSTGRPLEQRKLNLQISGRGIKDHGADRGYSPINLVMAARGCDRSAAFDWLAERVIPKDDIEVDFEKIIENAEAPSIEPDDADSGSDDAPGGPQSNKSTAPFRLLNYREMREQGYSTQGRMVIDGLVRTGALYSVNSQPGDGKTALLSEIARCVLGEIPFLGRTVRRSAVLYVPAEDPEDVRNRLQALDLLDVKMLVADDISLKHPKKFVDMLRVAITQMRGGFPEREIIIMYDTLRAGLGGQSVLDDRVTSPALVPLRKLVEEEGVVLFISNHTNRCDPLQTKGETLESIVAMELLIVREDEGRKRLYVGKNRYGPSRRKVGLITFKAEDVDGVPAALVDTIELSDDDTPQSKPKSQSEQALDELRKLMAEPEHCVAHDKAPGGYAVRTSRWFAAVDEAGILTGNKDPAARFRNLRPKLIAEGKVGEDADGGVSWIALPTT